MKRLPNPELIGNENPEWTEEDLRHSISGREFFAKLGIDPSPPHTLRVIPAKQPISIRLSADVLSAFRAKGKGWQTQIDNILREWLKAQNGHAAAAATSQTANGKNGKVVKRTPRTVGRTKTARPATQRQR